MNNVDQVPESDPQPSAKMCLDDLPVFPEVVLRLQELVRDENSTIPAMAELINSAPTLLAHLLRYVNSPRYSMGVEVNSAQIAIGVIGRQATTSLLTTVAFRDTFKDFSCKHVALADFFRYGLAVAATIDVIAEARKVTIPTEPIAIGILHNIGELAMLQAMSDEYNEHVIAADNPALTCRASREMDAFGFDHYGLGAELMRKWGLPDIYSEITESIPENAKVSCDKKTIVCVRTALAHTRINHAICPHWWLREAGEFSPSLINGDTVSTILEKSAERYETLSQMLS